MLDKRLRPVFQLEVPARTACHFQETLYFSLHLLCLSPHPGRLCFIHTEIQLFLVSYHQISIHKLKALEFDGVC